MLYIGFFILSILLTYLIREYANKKAILDIPNARSSHTTPTPRGGGLAIVMLFYVGLIYFYDSIDSKLFYALLCSMPIALVSIIDDIFTISSKIRFLVQAVSSAIALYLLGGVTTVDLELFELSGWWLNVFALVSMVWVTNLYNFMDGIDGYAGSQAVLLGVGLFMFFNNPLGLVIAATSLGFLVLNWHKASIFMGDVGSATLGFIFAVFIFYDTSHGSIFIWLVLLSLFWSDSTVTLIQRYRNGEPISEAHKKHSYQRLVQSGWSHDRVVLYSIGFNLIFIILLYMMESSFSVFILNMASLYIIIKFVDNRKSFYDNA